MEASPLRQPTPANPSHKISVADFNGDGITDLAKTILVSGGGLTAGDVVVIESNLNRWEQEWVPQPLSVPASGWETVFADITGDGKADLINVNRNPVGGVGDAYVHTNTGSGFTATPTHNFLGTIPTASNWTSFFADANGDGKADLWNYNFTSKTVYVHFQSAGQYFGSNIVQSNVGNSDTVLAADWNGDGLADLISLRQGKDHKIEVNELVNTAGTYSFSPSTFGTDLPREVYEVEYFLGDLNINNGADLIQHDLREGVVMGLARRPGQTISNPIEFSSQASHIGRTGRLAAPSRSQDLPESDDRIASSFIVYDIDHGTNITGTGRGPNGWWSLLPGGCGPGSPSTCEDTRITLDLSNCFKQHRTATSVLGEYNSNDPAVITQHAYWIRAMGIDGMLIDWTNTPNPTFVTNVESATDVVFQTLDSITDFAPPKAVITIRAKGTLADLDEAGTTAEINRVATMIANREHLLYYADDGSAKADKPLLVIFTFFSPDLDAFDDPRFNIRFTDGFHLGGNRVGPGDGVSFPILQDKPYWTFLENETVDPSGARFQQQFGDAYYKSVYRKIPGTQINEQTALWVSMWNGSPNPPTASSCPYVDAQGQPQLFPIAQGEDVTNVVWDGVSDTKTCSPIDAPCHPLQRTASAVFDDPPLHLLVGRFNYPLAYATRAQEGVSFDESGMIEPNDYNGDVLMSQVSDVIGKLESHVQRAPSALNVIGRPYLGNIQLTASNFPVRWEVSTSPAFSPSQTESGFLKADGTSGTLTIELSSAMLEQTLWIRVSNYVGDSGVVQSPAPSQPIPS